MGIDSPPTGHGGCRGFAGGNRGRPPRGYRVPKIDPPFSISRWPWVPEPAPLQHNGGMTTFAPDLIDQRSVAVVIFRGARLATFNVRDFTDPVIREAVANTIRAQFGDRVSTVAGRLWSDRYALIALLRDPCNPLELTPESVQARAESEAHRFHSASITPPAGAAPKRPGSELNIDHDDRRLILDAMRAHVVAGLTYIRDALAPDSTTPTIDFAEAYNDLKEIAHVIDLCERLEGLVE